MAATTIKCTGPSNACVCSENILWGKNTRRVNEHAFSANIMALFALPQRPGDLQSANMGMANAGWRQITATRDIVGTQFPRGIIQFRFQTGGNTWFVFNQSYFRIRYTLTQVRANGEAGKPILVTKDIAPNMGLMSNLFKTQEVQLNGKTVDRIGERGAQIDALKTRMARSKAWMDSTGKDTNHWQPDFESRRAAAAIGGIEQDVSRPFDIRTFTSNKLTQEGAGFDAATTVAWQLTLGVDGILTFNLGAVDILNGNMALAPGDLVISPAETQVFRVIDVQTATQARVQVVFGPNATLAAANVFFVKKANDIPQNDAIGKNSQELIWQPPLGIFDTAHAIPPGGNWTIEFNPQDVNSYQKLAVESLSGALATESSPTVAGQFKFEINEMYFYMYTVDAERFDDGEYWLDIQNVRCQVEAMPNDSTSLTQKNFDVHGSTNALTLAFQDIRAGTDTRSSESKFKIRTVVSNTGGQSILEGQELLLNRFFLNYGNSQKPSPDFDGQWLEATGNSSTNQINQLSQRWADSLMQAGGYHSEGGSETLKEWIARGPYYHFLWPRDASEDHTRVNVQYQFRKAFDGGIQHNVLLFSWWKTAYHIVHRNGRVDKVSFESL